MSNLKSHDVYELVPRMDGKRTLELGWVFHQKFKNAFLRVDSTRCPRQPPTSWYRLRVIISPIMRLESLRTILSLAAICDLDIIQFDITSTYLPSTPE